MSLAFRLLAMPMQPPGVLIKIDPLMNDVVSLALDDVAEAQLHHQLHHQQLAAAHAAAAELSVPAVTLHAEAHGCNAEGNGTTLAPAWSGPVWSAEIRGATHCDPEWPSNLSCRLFCGAPESVPSSAFPELALDAMDAVVRCDAEARRRLDHAGADPRIAWRSDDGWIHHLRTACPTESDND